MQYPPLVSKQLCNPSIALTDHPLHLCPALYSEVLINYPSIFLLLLRFFIYLIFLRSIPANRLQTLIEVHLQVLTYPDDSTLRIMTHLYYRNDWYEIRMTHWHQTKRQCLKSLESKGVWMVLGEQAECYAGLRWQDKRVDKFLGGKVTKHEEYYIHHYKAKQQERYEVPILHGINQAPKVSCYYRFIELSAWWIIF